MSTKQSIIIISLLILLACPAYAATLEGRVYDEELNEINNVIIEVNTTPWQRFVSKDGSYSFDLAPGTYSITANYSPDQYQTLTSEDHVTVSDNGSFVFDLFLFPGLDDALELLDDTEVIEPELELLPEYKLEIGVTAIVTAFIILFGILLYAYHWGVKMRRKELQEINKGIREAKKLAKDHPPDKKVKKVLEELEEKEQFEKAQRSGDETKIILDILKKEGGRATQKEIRKHIPLSEAKISLMIAELESQGKVKKVKKGRGNIIILN
ncbi:hypothetical protein ACFL0V_03090 [Nanoarchaeota archaeon]